MEVISNFQIMKTELTKNEFLTLSIMVAQPPLSGVQLTRKSGGQVSSGSAHFLLKKLHEKGLLTLSFTRKMGNGSGGEALYALTDLGREIGTLYSDFNRRYMELILGSK